MDTVLQDLRYGFRMLRKNPGFTTVAMLTLALGIGANTTTFSLMQKFLFYPFPVENPDRVGILYSTYLSRDIRRHPTSLLDFTDWQAQTKTFEELLALTPAAFNLTGKKEPLRVSGYRTTSNFFAALDIVPAHGRTFLPEENQPGAERVVVISHALWQRSFAGDPGIVGETISLDEESHTVVGITPAGFTFLDRDVDVWVPLALDPNQSDRSKRAAVVYGRIRDGVTWEQATAEMTTIAQRLEQQYPETNKGWGVRVIPLPRTVQAYVKLLGFFLYGPVMLVFLAACANVANLVLARAAGRDREIAIRMALGCGRLRLVRLLLTENLLLSLAGGGLGLLFALWSMDLIRKVMLTSPELHPLVESVRLSPFMLGFVLLLAILATLLFGIIPALLGSRTDVNKTLKEAGQSHGSRSGKRRLRNAFVVSQVAIAVVLMVTTGWIFRVMTDVYTADWGFDRENLLTLRVALPAKTYPAANQVTAFYSDVLLRTQTVAGVEGTAVASMVPYSPLGRGVPLVPFRIEGRAEPADGRPLLAVDMSVSPGYFRVTDIPLLRGRVFTEQDSAEAQPVAVVNRTLAQRFWPDKGPLEKRLKLGSQGGDTPALTIVGVVGDVIVDNPFQPPELFIYRPHAQNPDRAMSLIVRTNVDPLSLTAAMRQAVRAVDRKQPVFDIQTVEQLYDSDFVEDRISIGLLGTFAAITFVLATIGIYGVTNYTVAQQTHEIGIRMALGAQPRDIVRITLRRGMLPVFSGLALGLTGGFLIGLLFSKLFFLAVHYSEIGSIDPFTFAGTALSLTAVALLACYIPARRAIKVDPMVALRHE